MGKKRKADATLLDEADRNLYANFRSAANSLSLLYSHTVNQQRLSFQSGEHHALEKLYQWIMRQREEGFQVTTEDIVAYLQAEIEHDTTDDVDSLFPTPLDNSNSQTVSQSQGFDAPVSCNIPPSSNVGFDQQAKNSIFPIALTSIVRQSLQHYHLTDNRSHCNTVHSPDSIPSNNEPRNQGQRHRSPDPHASDDCTDMQTDDPSQKSGYRFLKHE